MHSRRREGLALLVSLVVLALALGLLTRLLTLKRHDMGSRRRSIPSTCCSSAARWSTATWSRPSSGRRPA